MTEQVIAATLFGCVGCQAGVELLQTKIKDSINLLTFCSFIFTATYGLISHAKFFTVRNKIPLRSYVVIVVIFFVINLCNNYAMKFDVHIPLFIIFKSGSLFANIILGKILRGFQYTAKQQFAVTVVTIGIVIFTLASYEPDTTEKVTKTMKIGGFVISQFIIGICLLTIALFLSAYLGLYQEMFYQKHGKHNEEMMFYVHLLSIPAFILVGNEMSFAWKAANESPNFEILGISIGIPSAWVYIAGINFLQFICTRNVYRMSSVTSSLNVTMVLTLRKFLSLVISFWVFDNPFNYFHIFGAVFVFLGSFIFSISSI